jgi:hypothetical protein
MSPLAHLVVFAAVGLPLGWLARRIGHPVAATLTVVLLTMAGGWCALLLFPQVHFLAQLLLTLGAATQFARWCDRHPMHARIAARRTALGLAALAAIVAVAQVGHRKYAEHEALSALATPVVQPPNVLLIVLDTVRADAPGVYGAPTIPRRDSSCRAGRPVLGATSTAS